MERIELVEVEKPRLTLKNASNGVGYIVGMTILAISVVFILSIVLIIPGIFGVLIGMVIAYKSVPKSELTCPACDTINRAAPPGKRVECEACATVIPIKWVKPKKKPRRN